MGITVNAPPWVNFSSSSPIRLDLMSIGFVRAGIWLFHLFIWSMVAKR